jgi:7,8-dihydroneopterin aldolase/epimerase/oxygenase
VWNPLVNHQCLALRDVHVAARVGVHAFEREKPQLLSVDVELYRRQERFTGTSLADCLDYDRLYYHITEQWPAREHVELLERLADDLADYCLADARVEACRVIIRKAEVYPGSAVPEITVYRLRPEAGDHAA